MQRKAPAWNIPGGSSWDDGPDGYSVILEQRPVEIPNPSTEVAEAPDEEAGKAGFSEAADGASE
jgi:hypothetical protein